MPSTFKRNNHALIAMLLMLLISPTWCLATSSDASMRPTSPTLAFELYRTDPGEWAVGWNEPVRFKALAQWLETNMAISLQGMDDTLANTPLDPVALRAENRIDLLIEILELTPGAAWDLQFSPATTRTLANEQTLESIIVDIRAFDPSVERRPMQVWDFSQSNGDVVKTYNARAPQAEAKGPTGAMISDEALRDEINASSVGEDGSLTRHRAKRAKEKQQDPEKRKYLADVSGVWITGGSTANRTPDSVAGQTASGGLENNQTPPMDGSNPDPEPPNIDYDPLPDFSPFYIPPGS